ncbi:MAG: fatty-acid synthase [Anaerolineae bacterium]|nr:fatty-acid synthase [Anaerolineae bacterium]
MPAKDYYHDSVVNGLIKDGWTITNEQFPIRVAERRFWIDIRATKSNGETIILVEVKRFYPGQSMVEALENALGQYMLYVAALKYVEENAQLILAIPLLAYNGIFSEPIGEVIRQTFNLKLAVFDPETEEIIQWIL